MNAKNILNALFMKSAMSSRNLSSLFLVAVFFGVYVAAGGKIAPVPKVDSSVEDGWGGANNAEQQPPESIKTPFLEGDIIDGSYSKAPTKKLKQEEEAEDKKKDLTSEASNNLDSIEARLERLGAGKK